MVFQRPWTIFALISVAGPPSRFGGGRMPSTAHASWVIDAMRSVMSFFVMFQTMLSVAMETGPE
jgi:hypothetical protein